MIRIMLAAALALALSLPAAAQPVPEDPVQDYQAAAELWRAGERERAAYLFYRGQLRGRLDVTARPDLDPSGRPALYASLNDVLGVPINGWLGGDVDLWVATMTRALDWAREEGDPFTPRAEHPQAYDAVLGGLEGLIAQVDEGRGTIRAQREAAGLENR